MKIDEWHWEDYPELGSTNDKAVEMSAQPPAPRYVITAQRQTKGRGRRGRDWISLDGNLFMSLAFEQDLSTLGQLIFVVSLSLLQTIKQFAPKADVKLKWPNDVLVNGCKVSGILLEKGNKEYIIAGIGVNVTAAPAPSTGLIYPAVSLREAGIEADRISFLKTYLRAFDRLSALWREQGFAPVRKLWLEHSRGLGEKIAVHTERGCQEGIFDGVDDNGLLLLRQGEAVIKIYAGDVFYI